MFIHVLHSSSRESIHWGHSWDNEEAGCGHGSGGCTYSTFGSCFPSLIQHSTGKGHCQGLTEGGKAQKTTQAHKELRELSHLLEGLIFNKFSSIGLVWGEVNQERKKRAMLWFALIK